MVHVPHFPRVQPHNDDESLVSHARHRSPWLWPALLPVPPCWTLQALSLLCAQSAHRYHLRLRSDLAPTIRGVFTGEQLQISLR